MQLSFSHIMKHWKRMPSTPGGSKSSTSRNILLRFYPPQSAVGMYHVSGREFCNNIFHVQKVKVRRKCTNSRKMKKIQLGVQ